MSQAELLSPAPLSPSVSLHSGRPATTSLAVAKFFGKRHDHVLRDIDALLSQLPENSLQPNFGETYQEQETPLGVKQVRVFILYRDGFMLLVMGYTGKKALAMKLAYIEAFNRMEAELAASSRPLADDMVLPASPDRPSRRTDPERKQLTAIINTWVSMAPIHYASARAQVNAHFGVASVDALTVAQVREAIAWVQAKIDALPPVPERIALPAPEKDKFEAYLEQVEAFRVKTEAERIRLLEEGVKLVDVYKFGPETLSGFAGFFRRWIDDVALSHSPLIAPYQSLERAMSSSPLSIIKEMEKILPRYQFK